MTPGVAKVLRFVQNSNWPRNYRVLSRSYFTHFSTNSSCADELAGSKCQCVALGKNLTRTEPAVVDCVDCADCLNRIDHFIWLTVRSSTLHGGEKREGLGWAGRNCLSSFHYLSSPIARRRYLLRRLQKVHASRENMHKDIDFCLTFRGD